MGEESTVRLFKYSLCEQTGKVQQRSLGEFASAMKSFMCILTHFHILSFFSFATSSLAWFCSCPYCAIPMCYVVSPNLLSSMSCTFCSYVMEQPNLGWYFNTCNKAQALAFFFNTGCAGFMSHGDFTNWCNTLQNIYYSMNISTFPIIFRNP